MQWEDPEKGNHYTALGVFWATVIGLVGGVLVGLVTEHYTGMGKEAGKFYRTSILYRCGNQYHCRSWRGYDVNSYSCHYHCYFYHWCF